MKIRKTSQRIWKLDQNRAGIQQGICINTEKKLKTNKQQNREREIERGINPFQHDIKRSQEVKESIHAVWEGLLSVVFGDSFITARCCKGFRALYEEPAAVVKAFLIYTQKKISQNKMGKKNHTVIKSICFAHSSFQKERVKQGPLVKKREIFFPPPPDSEYIPCEQMAEFPVLALWGNENAELLFAIILF